MVPASVRTWACRVGGHWLTVGTGVALGLVGGGLAAHGLRGNLLSLMISLNAAFAALAWLLVALAFLNWNLVTVRDARRRATARAVAAAIGLFVAFGLISLSWYVGALWNERDVAEARRYCESLIPVIEAHRRETGAYPRSLEAAGVARSDWPAYLRGEGRFYWVDEDEYRFDVSTTHLFVAYEYSSRTKEWMRTD